MARTKGNHGFHRGMKIGGGGASGPSGMQMSGGLPTPSGAPSMDGSQVLGAGETSSMPAPMPSATSAIPGGMGAGSMTPTDAGGFKRGGRVR